MLAKKKSTHVTCPSRFKKKKKKKSKERAHSVWVFGFFAGQIEPEWCNIMSQNTVSLFPIYLCYRPLFGMFFFPWVFFSIYEKSVRILAQKKSVMCHSRFLNSARISIQFLGDQDNNFSKSKLAGHIAETANLWKVPSHKRWISMFSPCLFNVTTVPLFGMIFSPLGFSLFYTTENMP